MAKENKAPAATEKGKGKAEDEKPLDTGKKEDDTKRNKIGRAVVKGKKGEDAKDGMKIVAVLMTGVR